jgi:hypothetical protein
MCPRPFRIGILVSEKIALHFRIQTSFAKALSCESKTAEITEEADSTMSIFLATQPIESQSRMSAFAEEYPDVQPAGNCRRMTESQRNREPRQNQTNQAENPETLEDAMVNQMPYLKANGSR